MARLGLFTIEAARLARLEAGAIEPGLLADLIVLPRDPFTLTPAELMNMIVEITIVGGRVVYEHGRPAVANSDIADLAFRMMPFRDSRAVLYERRGAVAWVTLNRPAELNALQYRDARRPSPRRLARFTTTPKSRAMVLRGAVPAFSVGGDLTEFGTAPSPIVARWVRFRRDVWGTIRALPIPTIAAIHGYTVGGGLEMALLCDVAIAADDTRSACRKREPE